MFRLKEIGGYRDRELLSNVQLVRWFPQEGRSQHSCSTTLTLGLIKSLTAEGRVVSIVQFRLILRPPPRFDAANQWSRFDHLWHQQRPLLDVKVPLREPNVESLPKLVVE